MKDSIIILDLDDTLIDTYNDLFCPLEEQATKKISDQTDDIFDRDLLLKIILKLRKSSPYSIKPILEQIFDEKALIAVNAYSEIYEDFDVSSIKLNTKLIDFLKRNSANHKLILLSEGDHKKQNEKIDFVGIRGFFKEIIIFNKSNNTTKLKIIQNLISNNEYIDKNFVVVGNRIDNEILAAQILGIRHVWVRHGEGIDIQIPIIMDSIDCIVNSLDELFDFNFESM